MDTSDAYRQIREDRKISAPRKPGTWADAYISLRRTLGFRTYKLNCCIRTLLNFMRARRLKSFDRIDRNLASEWLHSGTPQEATIARRIADMRGFFRYLLSFGVVDENIWETCPYPKPKHFVPYIYTFEELKTIFNYLHAQIALARPRFIHARCAHFTMFHTIYACGLRAQEVCHLKVGDVDFKHSFFIIRDTKFYKTRIVPFNSRTRELILTYLYHFRPADDDLHPGAPLFINYRKCAFLPGNLSLQFARVCKSIGIYQSKKVKGNTVFGGTTTHSLRHSFAVHRLLKWYEEGADINAKLPLLATYMGHSHYHQTQRYLTVLPVFIDMAGKMFADKFETPLKDLECPHNP